MPSASGARCSYRLTSQELRHGSQPPRGVRLHGSRRYSQRFGNLGLWEIEVVAEHQALALAPREAAKGSNCRLVVGRGIGGVRDGRFPPGLPLEVTPGDRPPPERRTGEIEHRDPEVGAGFLGIRELAEPGMEAGEGLL